jgi:tetratricopeptide (TPR) repeat protein
VWLFRSTERNRPRAAAAEIIFNAAFQLAQEKHYDAAAEEFGKAIKDNPKDARAYANRGTAYRQAARTAVAAGDSEGASTRYQSALADFAKYIELAPKDASATRNTVRRYLN